MCIRDSPHRGPAGTLTEAGGLTASGPLRSRTWTGWRRGGRRLTGGATRYIQPSPSRCNRCCNASSPS
eukprot:5758744-Prymnesium_polylepis.1